MSRALIWTLDPFADLTGAVVARLLRVRQLVFIAEQRCAYVDADGLDPLAVHLAAWEAGADDGLPLAYARLLPPGLTFPQPAIGRVLTWGAGRGCGLGSALLARAIDACERRWPSRGQALSAQRHLVGWYGRFGFVPVGEPYDEDGIAHQDMRREPGPVAWPPKTPERADG
jgi:ElaA protein